MDTTCHGLGRLGLGHYFISYSRSDRGYVEQLARHLEVQRVDVWFDYEIEAGLRWTAVIERKIESCDAMIVVMSPKARESVMVENEIDFARSRGKDFIPLLLDGEPFFGLRHIQFVDVRGGALPGPSFVTKLGGTPSAPAGHSPNPPTGAQSRPVSHAHVAQSGAPRLSGGVGDRPVIASGAAVSTRRAFADSAAVHGTGGHGYVCRFACWPEPSRLCSCPSRRRGVPVSVAEALLVDPLVTQPGRLPAYRAVQRLDPLGVDGFMARLACYVSAGDLAVVLDRLGGVVARAGTRAPRDAAVCYASLRDLDFMISAAHVLDEFSYQRVAGLEDVLEGWAGRCATARGGATSPESLLVKGMGVQSISLTSI